MPPDVPATGVARVVFFEDGEPTVVTVNYLAQDVHVWFRTTGTSVLARSVPDRVVVLALDLPTTASSAGDRTDALTVTVTGRCRPVADPPEHLRVRLSAWAPGVRDVFFAVDVALVDVLVTYADGATAPQREGTGGSA